MVNTKSFLVHQNKTWHNLLHKQQNQRKATLQHSFRLIQSGTTATWTATVYLSPVAVHTWLRGHVLAILCNGNELCVDPGEPGFEQNHETRVLGHEHTHHQVLPEVDPQLEGAYTGGYEGVPATQNQDYTQRDKKWANLRGSMCGRGVTEELAVSRVQPDVDKWQVVLRR